MSFAARSVIHFACKLFVVTVLAAVACGATAKSRAFREVSWQPSKIMTGSPCIFRVRMSAIPATLVGTWQKRTLTFVSSGEAGTWYALAGVDVAAKPGTYKLQLEATFANGRTVRERRSVQVGRAKFPKEKLRVAERYVEPDPETLLHIEADHQLKQAAFSNMTTTAAWSGDFHPPIDSTVSEAFGTRRTFNGKLASIHRGVDYHAAPKTPVFAANDGEVILARELYYEGNCVIIDHGQQFTTIYMHLSQLEVSEGQQVRKGDELGLSGATGRVTGPHLHVAVRWQGAYLDPLQLWNLPVPELRPVTLVPATAQK